MEYIFPVIGLLIVAAFVLTPLIRRFTGRKRDLAPPSGRVDNYDTPIGGGESGGP